MINCEAVAMRKARAGAMRNVYDYVIAFLPEQEALEVLDKVKQRLIQTGATRKAANLSKIIESHCCKELYV